MFGKSYGHSAHIWVNMVLSILFQSLLYHLSFSVVALECFDKSKKNLPLMPLQSLKEFTILYCGTRPNTMIPRQSRSVSPVKDNSSTANDKSKPASTSVTSRPTHRLLTQSTPLFTASSQRKSVDKGDSHHASSISSKDSSRTDSQYSAKSLSSSSVSTRTILPAIVPKTDDNITRAAKTNKALVKIDHKIVKTETNTAKPEPRVVNSEKTVAKPLSQETVAAVKPVKVENKEITEIKTEETEIPQNVNDIKSEEKESIKSVEKVVSSKDNEKVETENKIIDLKESNEDNKSEAAAKDERRPSEVDTLTRTQNSLNLATSALGKINVSLNQVGLTDSLLEEVRLKMTHAEPSVSAAKPNSARSSRGQRENLERGN